MSLLLEPARERLSAVVFVAMRHQTPRCVVPFSQYPLSPSKGVQSLVTDGTRLFVPPKLDTTRMSRSPTCRVGAVAVPLVWLEPTDAVPAVTYVHAIYGARMIRTRPRGVV